MGAIPKLLKDPRSICKTLYVGIKINIVRSLWKALSIPQSVFNRLTHWKSVRVRKAEISFPLFKRLYENKVELEFNLVDKKYMVTWNKWRCYKQAWMSWAWVYSSTWPQLNVLETPEQPSSSYRNPPVGWWSVISAQALIKQFTSTFLSEVCNSICKVLLYFLTTVCCLRWMGI